MTPAQLLKLEPDQALRLVILMEILRSSNGLATPVTLLEAAFFTPVLAEVVKSGQPPQDEFMERLQDHWDEAFGTMEMEEAIEEAETAVKN